MEGEHFYAFQEYLIEERFAAILRNTEFFQVCCRCTLKLKVYAKPVIMEIFRDYFSRIVILRLCKEKELELIYAVWHI